MTSTKTVKLTATEQKIILFLAANKNATTKEIGAHLASVNPLTEQYTKRGEKVAGKGFVKATGSRKHVVASGDFGRGRPATEFALTKKGRDKARRLLASIEKAAQAEAVTV